MLLCLLCVSSEPYGKGSYSPNFEKQRINKHIQDGYWIEPFQSNNHTPVGFIAYGLAEGDIKFYQNPYIDTNETDPISIQKLLTPIAMDQADITGNGLQDIIICFDYGNTILDFNPDGGYIIWLENPGNINGKEPWKRHYVGKSATMHRLKIGHFTQTERWEIIGMPVVNGPFDVPVPVLLFRQPDDVLNATSWDSEIIESEFFHLIHDTKMFSGESLDKLIIASSEGLHWFYYNESSQQWTIEKIVDGEQEEKQQTNYYGTGGVDIGRIGNDPIAYIPAIEPFHGDIVAVYVKSINSSSKEIQWQRHILDVYGYPNQNGEGPGHHVICADFDKDGEDEFLLALRGPAPNEGVYYYKAFDLSRGLFAKWKISDESAGRIALADFDNDGLLDFATIGYRVAGYHLAKNASINIFYNRQVNTMLQSKPELQVTKQNDELLFTVPRPNKVSQYQMLTFLTIGGITLSLEILPPFSSRQVSNNTYVKVLSGVLMWVDSSTKTNQSRTFLCQPKSICSLEVNSDDKRVKTGNDGAIFIVMQMPKGMNDVPQFDSIGKVMLENSLPEHCPEEARKLSFKFTKADQLEWGKEKFKDVEFYNMRGFNIKFADNDEHLCHMQLWAAGKGTNAGVHNHATDRFCEVHTCIINGNGNSGMQYLNSSQETYDPFTMLDSDFVKLNIPSFYEHGPLWDIDVKKQPVLRNDGTVIYPWHKWQSGSDAPVGQQQNKVLTSRDILKNSVDASVPNQSYDIWMAIEFNIKLSTVPS
ncbi:unnamed protein product [Adineta steineri]|uniref:Aldos-2-ulose dehydratase/isomerase (AUDH) Cupin domain-containing protein n=1 Tax=Adineta steineri TaxID=433720 RepID=A0A814QZK8_9BILA|nr:unnamed protein product [Adineta steineri]CAF1210216.1 unnamed protein product [Adineta steineri]